MAYEHKEIIILKEDCFTMEFTDLIYESLQQEDIEDYILNFFDKMEEDSFPVNLCDYDIEMNDKTLILKNKNTGSFTFIDLTKIIMIEFVKK